MVFPCHADADRAALDELKAFLDPQCDLDWCAEDACVPGGGQLLIKIEESLTADVVLVLLSPDSVPALWVREQWEPILMEGPRKYHTKVGLVLLRECRFPLLLRNQAFFDLTADKRNGFRRIKRWLLDMGRPANPPFFAPDAPEPSEQRLAELEELRRQLADSPGAVTLRSPAPALAAQFAHLCRDDFHGVLWVRCGQRSPARVAGELAWQLGLRLEGETRSNQDELRRFCAQRRCLIVFHDVQTDADQPLIPGGRASVLLITTTEGAEESELSQLLDQVALTEDWPQLCALAPRALRLARDEGRLAEADELIERWFTCAERRGDRRILDECARERIWILEKWDRSEEAQQLERYRLAMAADQLSFDFIQNLEPASAPPSSSPAGPA